MVARSQLAGFLRTKLNGSLRCTSQTALRCRLRFVEFQLISLDEPKYPLRRSALIASTAVLSASALGACAISASSASRLSPSPKPPLLRPRKLAPGQTIGLVAPGGFVDDVTINKSIANLQSMGFKVKLSPNIRERWGGYAGSVEQRVHDLHALFLDKAVDAIWAVRGGSGTNALLPFVNYDLIRENPKILIGYSDLTALLLAINYRTGLVCFHGPVASSTFSDYSVAYLKSVLMRSETHKDFTLSGDHRAGYKVLRAGSASGRLMGGNLSVLAALIGTPYLGPLAGSLLFLEEIAEAPYRIDRHLNQLQQVGLAQCAAVLLGVFVKCDPPDNDPSLTLAEVLSSQLSSLNIPSAYGYSFGHVAQQITLPVGVLASFDSVNQSLTLLEAAVI